MPDEESAAMISKSFRAKWERPPMESLERALRRKLSIEEARRILFLPEEMDVLDYSVALSKLPPGCPPEHPLSKVQSLFLGTLYTCHREDKSLMRAFVVKAGGLRALVGLLADENVYVVSQALHTLYTLTSLLDWHDEKPDAPLLQCLANLAHHDVGFVKALEVHCFVNRFPGCSFLALSVLAFWLSTLRHFFCKDRILRLGPDVLRLLHRWSTREDGTVEEHKLAATLYEDFARFPLVDGSEDGSLTAERPANLATTPLLPASMASPVPLDTSPSTTSQSAGCAAQPAPAALSTLSGEAGTAALSVDEATTLTETAATLIETSRLAGASDPGWKSELMDSELD